MVFDDNRPIYLQICDSICERVLSGELPAEERIPSVREYAAIIGVNPNTVSRSFERLTDDGIIYTKRGLGYFVSEDARNIVLEKEKAEFMENELPKFLKRIELLGIEIKEMIK